MLKQRLSLIGLSLVAILLALGFSVPVNTRAQDATAEPVPTATPVVAEVGTGSIHIEMWDGLTGSDGATMNAMEAEFVKENPDYSITDEEIDWNTLYPKLQAAFVAGTPPDVFIVHVAEIPQFQSLGVIQANDDLFDTNGGPLPAADFADPAFSNTLIDGQRYGVLLDNHGFGTWVNTDLLTAAGLDPNTPPAGGADTIAMFQKLTLDANGKNALDPAFDPNNIVQWGVALDWPHYTFQSIMFQFGGSVISPDGKTATINQPESVNALTAITDLIYKYHVMPAPAGFDPWASFAGGKVAVMGTGTWFRNRITQDPNFHWKTWPMYQLGPNPGTMFGAHVFLIPDGVSDDKVAAVKTMMVWMSNHDDMWAASGQVPARISIRDGLDMTNYPSNVTIGQTFQKFGHMEVPSAVSLDIGTAEDPELDAALNNQKTPQQALDDAAARIQQILDRQG